MTTSDRIDKFIKLAALALRIRYSDVSWRLKYDLIISKEISHQMVALNLVPEYRHPRNIKDYEGIVLAFVNAIEERRVELLRILPIIEAEPPPIAINSKGN